MNLGSKSERRTQPTKRATPLRARLREAAREQILEAAEAVFAERGIQTARVEEIAERSGVSVGTLYNYFGDRQGLVQALLEQERAELLHKADRALAASEGRPLAERLRDLLDVTLAHFEAHRKLFTLLADDELCHQRAMRRHKSVLKEILVRVDQLTAKGVKDRVLRAEHADLYPIVVVGMLKSLFARHVLLDEDRAVGVTGAQLVDLLFEGARRRG